LRAQTGSEDPLWRAPLFLKYKLLKIIQDITAGIKSEVNVEDTLSLGNFKTTLGFHHITNNPDAIKRDGNFEYHSQFCEDVGSELLIEAFKTFVAKYDEDIDKTEDGGVKLILEYLKRSDIKYYYDPENYNEIGVHDDMMSSCKDNAARTVMSLVLDSVEHEGDGLGLRAVRTVLIPYFLNRKEDHQDSKYAPRLLFNRICYLQASERTQARIDLMACCNPSGKPGHSIARDMQNEFKVKSTKVLLRGLHSQLGDLSVEKTVTGSNILEIIDGHDKQAMLIPEEAGKSSCRYVSEAQKKKMRAEIAQMKPFDYKRQKIEYFDKPRGIFSGLNAEQIDRFLLRNKNNFRRNSPHKAYLPEKNVLVGAPDRELEKDLAPEVEMTGVEVIAVPKMAGVKVTCVEPNELDVTRVDGTAGLEMNCENVTGAEMTCLGETIPEVTRMQINGVEVTDAGIGGVGVTGPEVTSSEDIGSEVTFAEMTRAEVTVLEVASFEMSGLDCEEVVQADMVTSSMDIIVEDHSIKDQNMAPFYEEKDMIVNKNVL
jgi:hypothetical protein